MPAEGNLNPVSPAHSDTLIIDNDEDAQSYHDYDQGEDSDSQYDQTDYDNNTIVGDICTTFLCKRKDATEMCRTPYILKA